MVGRHAPGRTFEAIADFRNVMHGLLLSGDLATTLNGWPELPVFAVVHHHPARHEASLLALDAILEARDRLAAP